MRRAHTWVWARTRRCDDPSNDLGPLSSHQSCPDCIIATPGYDFGKDNGRPGKTGIRRGSSVRSDGIVLTMSLCSANDISAICSIPTKDTTTRLVHTADCTTNISERRFPTGTG